MGSFFFLFERLNHKYSNNETQSRRRSNCSAALVRGIDFECLSYLYLYYLLSVGPSNLTHARITSRINALTETWEKFSIVHDALLIAIGSLNAYESSLAKANPYFANDIFVDTRDAYTESLEKMTTLLERESDNSQYITPFPAASNSSSSFTSFVNRAKLPRLDLPKFDGSPAEWLSFKDFFGSLVLSNPTLTPVERLQYLKTSLTGSAALFIKNTALTADNFQKTWDALIAYYENKRTLVTAALHSLTSLKRMTKESASEMEQLYSNIMQLYRTLETLQRPVESWDDIFVFIAVQRLDSESVKLWEQQVGASKETPSWEQLSNFIITRMVSLQAYEKSKGGKSVPENKQRSIKAHYQGKASNNETSDLSFCVFCKLKHKTTRCPTYNSKTVPQRRDLIIKHRLCFNCLKPHRSIVCKSTNRCLKCARKHHTTIHDNRSQDKSTTATVTKTDTPTASTSVTDNQNNIQILHVSSKQDVRPLSVLLATANVLLISPAGESYHVRVLIDQGAELSLVSERLVQRLRLPRTRLSIPLVGIGGQKSNTTNGSTSFRIKSIHGSFECNINAHILPKLTASLPSMRIKQRSWSHLDGLSLADPDFLTPRAIDLILGADAYSRILERGLIKGPTGSPMAQATKLGWIISGPISETSSPSSIQGYHVCCDDQLYRLIHRFWELDEVPSVISPILSTEEQQCEDHFLQTYTRDYTGRYVVRLPFKQPPNQIGDSKSKALRLIHKLSNSLSADPAYYLAYSEFIKEYENLGHMIEFPAGQSDHTTSYYLPHHGVWKKNSPTIKLRVVFNGSSRTTAGVSLNNILHVGAKLQADLIDVLLQFRLFQYVFSADIEKMYKQIKVHQDDQKYQRIFWINQDQHLITYQLTTVTYELACAPFLALRTFLQLVNDESSKFPLSVPALTKGRYVDDIFGGADTIEEACITANQLRQLCMAGGFELRKWISNHPNILKDIPPKHQLHSHAVTIEDSTFVHTLGLSWHPASDTFRFTFDLHPLTVISKRSVMSVIARLFDPLGLVSPVLITGKLFIQELWVIKLDWDDPLPVHLANRWTEFFNSLQELPLLAFPRWVGHHSKTSIELHIFFCDSSQNALAAVIYARSIDLEH